MRKLIRKEITRIDLGGFDPCLDTNVENFKRRRALQPYWSLDISSKMFFDRVLHVRRDIDPIFITKAQSKNR